MDRCMGTGKVNCTLRNTAVFKSTAEQVSIKLPEQWRVKLLNCGPGKEDF